MHASETPIKSHYVTLCHNHRSTARNIYQPTLDAFDLYSTSVPVSTGGLPNCPNIYVTLDLGSEYNGAIEAFERCMHCIFAFFMTIRKRAELKLMEDDEELQRNRKRRQQEEEEKEKIRRAAVERKKKIEEEKQRRKKELRAMQQARKSGKPSTKSSSASSTRADDPSVTTGITPPPPDRLNTNTDPDLKPQEIKIGEMGTSDKRSPELEEEPEVDTYEENDDDGDDEVDKANALAEAALAEAEAALEAEFEAKLDADADDIDRIANAETASYIHTTSGEASPPSIAVGNLHTEAPPALETVPPDPSKKSRGWFSGY